MGADRRPRIVPDRQVAFAMITISRFEDDRSTEEWEIADTVSLLAQLAALPSPNRA